MARKDLLKSVMETTSEESSKDNRADYALRGASKSMKVSIDHMAENAKKMLEGETIVDINPDLIDVSFVNDRLTGDDDEYQELKSSIEGGQQDTPVLLRPHPKNQDRYMIVFGHRRVRVATELGRKVRAVVKPMDDLAHVLAQGQENTARADLSFIEKALFAKNLIDMGQPKEVVQSALTIDATLLSRMLSVSQKIPADIIEAIGAAKSVGRDRWEDFKKLAIIPANTKRAREIVNAGEFQKSESDARFEMLLNGLKTKGRPRKTASVRSEKRVWNAGDGRIKASLTQSPKAFSISLTSVEAPGFGNYLSENLEQLYRAFQAQKTEEN